MKTHRKESVPILWIVALLGGIALSAFSIGIPPTTPKKSLTLAAPTRALPIGDGKADDTTAIQDMLDDTSLPVVNLKGGTYRCSAPLRNNGRTIRLEGEGTTTILLFSVNTPGIIITRKPDGRGDRSLIRSLTLRSMGGTDSDAHGITLTCGRALLSDLIIDRFPGNGIELIAGNLWTFSRVNCRLNGGDGFHLSGSDVNAGLGLQLDIVANKGWGIREEGITLGSTYVACHAATNSLGGYSIGGNNASSCLFGCYTESGQAGTKLGQRALAIGGTHGAGFDESGFPGGHIGHDWMGFRSTRFQEITFHSGLGIRGGSAPPSAGVRGQMLFNQYTDSSRAMGWICTKSSTPATTTSKAIDAVWKELPKIP
jgi:hypothetical protein